MTNDDMAMAYGDPCPNWAAGIACDCNNGHSEILTTENTS